jgi:hypothetical protein
VIEIAGVLIALIVCALALAKGAQPERMTAIAIAMAWFSVVAAETAFSREQTPLVILCADGILATALLFISIQYASLWLGGAMLVQSSAFALHAWYLTEQPVDRTSYLLAVSLLSYTVLLLLLMATLTRWIGRVRRRRAYAGPARAPALPRLWLDLTGPLK